MISYLTIGRLRTDGDIDVLATLNNDWLALTDKEIIHNAKRLAKDLLGEDYIILERQDAPDVIEFIEDEAEFNSDYKVIARCGC